MARVLWLQRRPRFDRVPVYLHATLAAFLHLPRSTDSPPRTTWIGDEIVVSPTTSYASQQAEKFKNHRDLKLQYHPRPRRAV